MKFLLFYTTKFIQGNGEVAENFSFPSNISEATHAEYLFPVTREIANNLYVNVDERLKNYMYIAISTTKVCEYVCMPCLDACTSPVSVEPINDFTVPN